MYGKMLQFFQCIREVINRSYHGFDHRFDG